LTVDPTGQFVYVANEVSDNISAYTLGGSTGALTPIAGSPFPTAGFPNAVTTTAGPAQKKPQLLH